MSYKRAHLVLAAALLTALLVCLCACNNTNTPVEPEIHDIEVNAPTDGAVPAYTPEGQHTEAATAVPSQQTEADPTPDATQSTEEVPGTDEPAVSETPSASPDNSATPTPANPIGQPTAAPTATAAPDPVMQAIWFDDSAPVYCDMDFDGKNEKVEIKLDPQNAYTYTCTVKVTVGATGKELTDSFSTEYFTKALINNFNSGDGRAELLVCCGTGNRGQLTKAYRLNASSNALNSFGTNGWIETLSGNKIQLGRYIDVLGTWACTCGFSFSTTDFALVQADTEWIVHRDSDRWCTVSQALLVQIFIPNSSEDTAGFLYYGDMIYPTSTDLYTYIKFKSDLDENGAITISTGSNGTILINGASPNDWFLDLEYIQ